MQQNHSAAQPASADRAPAAPPGPPRPHAGGHTTGSIAAALGAELRGPGDLAITDLAALDQGGAGSLTFIRSVRYLNAWPASGAAAALVTRGLAIPDGPAYPGPGRALLLVPDADLAMIAVLGLFAPEPARPEPGVHPTCVVHPGAQVAATASLGPWCVLEDGARVGEGTVLVSGVYLGRGARVGRGCTMHPGVRILERCTVGDGCIFWPGVAIGADGFGYRPDPSGRGVVKIPHIGTVEIGNGVEIGSNSAVDRGKFGATRIGDGTKIDNLCQIGHNCLIGRAVVICGLAGIGGSVTIGDGAVLAGHVGVEDQRTIGARATILSKSGVMSDVPAGEVYFGVPAGPHKDQMRSYAALRRLSDHLRTSKKREKDEPEEDGAPRSAPVPTPRSGRTLAAPATVRGVGLFTGAAASLTLRPAPPGTGLVFRRVDLPGSPEVPALVGRVAPEPRHTVLGAAHDPKVRVHTSEHVLSALAARGVTDAYLDLDGPEAPTGDGSAAPFVAALEEAGVVAAGAAPAPIVVARAFEIDEGSMHIRVAPPVSEGTLTLEYRLDYGDRSALPAQAARLELGGAGGVDDGAGWETYRREIAPARTFCLVEEAMAARALGLFGHLGPRDMLVIGEDGSPIENTLRFADEPARHKVLDLLGDLALAGRPVQARITATRSGHALNHALVRALLAGAGAEAGAGAGGP